MTAVRALILWDVDNTLVSNGGVSKEIYAAAFSAVAGRQPSRPPRTEGRTDRLIMREMFEADDIPMPSWTLIASELQRAGEDRFTEMQQRGAVLPGVRQAIAAIASDHRFVQSVLTGNIKPNAQVKLSAVGLGPNLNLEVGAYGSDGDDRAALVAVARQRAGARYERTFAPRSTVLIGDTPRDVDAALRGGADVIAVASGVHTSAELRAAGATVVLSSLADPLSLARLMAHLESVAG